MSATNTSIEDLWGHEPATLGEALEVGKKVAPDAINLLMLDHREAENFFRYFEETEDNKSKVFVVRNLCLILKVHMQIEEEIFYPTIKNEVDSSLVEHSEEEHLEAKNIIEYIEGVLNKEEVPKKTVSDLQESIQHHVKEEERKLFPQVRNSNLELYILGGKMAARKDELLTSAIQDKRRN